MDPKDTTDPFAKYGAKADEDPFAKYGAKADEPSTPAPIQAAQTSISQAFNAPAAGKGGLLSDVGDYLGEAAAGFGSGVVAGVPFGLGPSIVGALTPGETTEDVERTIAENRKKSPIMFGAGSFGAELPTFLTGAAAGEKLAEKAAPAAARYLSPGLRKAGEYLLKGVGLGGVTGPEAAIRAKVEGAPTSEALKTGVETGLSMAALPATFAAAPAVVGAIPGAGRVAKGLASTAAPVALAVKSAPGEGADAADWTKWALTQGMMAGGEPVIETALGPKAAYERLAASSREKIQPKLRRAEAEGMELARGDVYKDVLADEAVRNKQFRAAVVGEQRAIRTADQIRQGDVRALSKLEADVRDADKLAQGLADGTDPSLRGLLGKLFQDVSNRLLRSKQALANRPELAGTPIAEKIATVDRLIEESYLKNTEKGGYLEDFNDDPYVRLEEIRKERAADATRKRDRLAGEQAALLENIGMRNYLEEARTKTKPPPVPEARLRQMAEEAGLEYAGPDAAFGAPTRHRLAMSPERRAELDAQTQAEFERQVAAGGRLLQGRAPEAEYGEKPPFFDPMNPMRPTAVISPKLPDWVKPAVAGKIAAGVFRGTARAPQSKFTEVQEATNPLRPSQGTLERPYNAVAMLRAWDKVLEAPSSATRGVIARIADRMGITPDKLMRTTAYRASALEQALKDPEVAKEVMANVAAP
jgi:hypothetical protein